MEQVEKIMRALGCTEAEALDVIATDKAIEQGADPFPLSAEQKAVEKKMKNAGTRTVYKFEKKERKADDEKIFLLSAIQSAINEVGAEHINLVNPQRELVFIYNGKKYKITLSAPRT